jgi:hypothetical protein
MSSTPETDEVLSPNVAFLPLWKGFHLLRELCTNKPYSGKYPDYYEEWDEQRTLKDLLREAGGSAVNATASNASQEQALY